MLDAYIIDRIRREREQTNRRNSQVPLYIDNPDALPEPPQTDIPGADRDGPGREQPERGSVVIDFKL